MTLPYNNTNIVSANNVVVNGTSLSDLYATSNYVDTELSNIDVGSGGGGITQQDLEDAISPIIAVNDGQYLVITDFHNSLANNFRTTTQLNISFYNKTEVDSAIAVVGTKALDSFNPINAVNTHLANNCQTNAQLATSCCNKTEIGSNSWIDATALALYATTATPTANYETNSQLARKCYNKTEIGANNWIDATALTPYGLTSALTNDYLTSRKIATSGYTKRKWMWTCIRWWWWRY